MVTIAAKNNSRAQQRGLLIGQDVKIRRNLRDMGFLYVAAGFALAALVCGLLILWCRLAVVDTGYEISKLNEMSVAEAEKNKRLKLELMRLKSPQRLETIAIKELGLSYPTPKQILLLKK